MNEGRKVEADVVHEEGLIMTTENGSVEMPPPGKPTRKKKKSADFRYQVKRDDMIHVSMPEAQRGWSDSPKSYKGPMEALRASEDDPAVKDGHCIVRVIRIASDEFETGTVTKVQLKKRTT